MTSTHWNGPLPMIFGLLGKVLRATLGDIFDQMCSGRMGISPKLLSRAGVGAEQSKRTV